MIRITDIAWLSNGKRAYRVTYEGKTLSEVLAEIDRFIQGERAEDDLHTALKAREIAVVVNCGDPKPVFDENPEVRYVGITEVGGKAAFEVRTKGWVWHGEKDDTYEAAFVRAWLAPMMKALAEDEENKQ